MQESATKITAHLVNQKIAGIQFFNLNDSYFIFDPNSIWVFDTGIQLTLESGIFSFGWNSEFDGFDYSTEKTMDQLQTDETVYTIDPEETKALEQLIGATITDVSYEWDYYQDYDEFAQLKEEKIYVPVQIKLQLDNDHTLQLAALRYGIHPETKQIAKANFDLQGQLFVSLNNVLEVEQA